MLKHISCLLLCLSTFIGIKAQGLENNAFFFGAGYARHLVEGVNTAAFSAGFQKDFFPRTAIELSLTALLPAVVREGIDEQEMFNLQFAINMRFKILDERKQSLHAGIGAAAGYFQTRFTDRNILIEDPNPKMTPGFSLLGEYRYIFPNQWAIGIRTVFASFDQDSRTWILSPTLVYKF